MSDRETLEKVAKSYKELMAAQAQQRVLMAQMIRACLQRLKSPSSRDRKEALDALGDLAGMLEKSE